MEKIHSGKNLFFKHGIDSITQKKRNDIRGSMPDKLELSPAEQSQRPQLDSLLHQPDGNSFLEDKLAPDFEDRELLLPSKFQRALDDSLTAMINIASDKDTKTTSDNNIKIMNRAIRVLKEDVELRDLLRMYRAALLQG
jgi:type III secretion protein X